MAQCEECLKEIGRPDGDWNLCKECWERRQENIETSQDTEEESDTQ